MYNRFRYYDGKSGTYISQDPIKLNGGINLYHYSHNTNAWLDPFGLSNYDFDDDLADIAKSSHNELIKHGKDKRGFNNSTVSVAEVQLSDGTTQLYASGNGAKLSPAQRTKLIELGVPEENIFSGKAYKEFIDGERGVQTKLANHAERVIERNIPKNATIKKWGISWASKQKNEMCPNCQSHFGCNH